MNKYVKELKVMFSKFLMSHSCDLYVSSESYPVIDRCEYNKAKMTYSRCDPNDQDDQDDRVDQDDQDDHDDQKDLDG